MNTILPSTMFRALTICQPHASAIIDGPKRFENRTWETNYHGPLIIHAGKSKKWLNPIAREFYTARGFSYGHGGSGLTMGAAIGLVWLEGSFPLRSVQPERRFKECAEGPFCWHVYDPLKFETPIPMRGALGLINVPAITIIEVPGVREWLRKHQYTIND